MTREQFLKRTAARFRAATGASRGLNAREQALMEFVYEETMLVALTMKEKEQEES